MSEFLSGPKARLFDKGSETGLDPAYRRAKAGVDVDLGPFLRGRANPHDPSVALGHSSAATAARILSQTVEELGPRPSGSRMMASVRAGQGRGSVAYLERT